MNFTNECDIPKSVRFLIYGGVTKAVKKKTPFFLIIELNKKCEAGCRYCYAGSDHFTEISLQTDRLFKFLDEAWSLGVRVIYWFGGDPLLHPDWYEIMSYSAKKRFANAIILPGLISKENAGKLVSLKSGLSVSIHMDTIDPETYRLVNKNPATLKERIKGCYNLLEAGFPRKQISGYIILCKPAARSIERTIDWFVDELGTDFVSCSTYKDQKFMKMKEEFEPGLSEKRKAVEYRDKKLGNYRDLMGSPDLGSSFCRTLVTLHADGTVSPCLFLYDFSMGNIYRQSLTEIVDKHRDEILFNFEIKGSCPNCQDYKTVCIGCRADAYHYRGDIRASDPKCYRNPEAKETYFSTQKRDKA